MPSSRMLDFLFIWFIHTSPINLFGGLFLFVHWYIRKTKGTVYRMQYAWKVSEIQIVHGEILDMMIARLEYCSCGRCGQEGSATAAK